MRILDEENNELTEIDEALGWTEPETIVTAHHDAVEAVEEVWHYEIAREYPNGGKDLEKVVDVPGVAAQDAWDETEEILRFHPYSAEELAEREDAAAAERAELEAELTAELEAAAAIERENALLRAQVSALTENLAFLEDCIVEMAEIIYN